MRRIGSRALLAAATVTATTTAMLFGVLGTAAAAPAPGDAGVLRTVARGADVSFPAGQAMGKPAGIQSPERRPQTEADQAAATARANVVSPTGVPVVAATPVAGPAGLVRSFHALDGFDSRYANNGNQFSTEPPDQALCAGNGYVFEAVNSVLRVYQPSGSAASGITDLNTFFGYKAAYNRTTGVIGPDVYDPTCLFDAATQRWFVTVGTLEVDPSTGLPLGPNHIDIAVSRTSNPLGGYAIYRLAVQDDGSQGTPSHKSCPCQGDFPHIAVDKYGFYVTTNEFPFSGPGIYDNFNGAQVYAFDKAALAARASSVNVVQFSRTQLHQGGSTVPAFSLAPAQVPGTAYQTAGNGTEYFLDSVADASATGQADAIGVYALTNTRSISAAHPALALTGALRPSERYVVPPMSTQKLGPTPLANYCTRTDCFGFGPGQYSEGPVASNDSRMHQVYLAGGRLYGALTTGVQVSGKLQAGIAWFLIDPGTSPATSSVAHQGYVAVANQNVLFPAIAALASGRGAMGYTLTGQGSYPSAAYSLLGSSGVTGAVHVAAAGVGPQDGFTEYAPLTTADSAPQPRWGDYGAAVPMGSQIWLASEYIGQSCSFAAFQQDLTCGGTRAPFMNWGTRISAVTP
ncbi:MAG: hypothetical protein ACXVXT_11160 [Blastococcus sp.]